MDEDRRSRAGGVSRRDLLKRSVLVVGVLSGGGLLAACSAAAPQASPAATQAAPAATSAAPAAAATQPAAAAAATPAGAAKKGGTLVIGMEAEISSLDPAIMTGTSTFRPVS